MTEIGRAQFSGKTAFILSAAASAVGLGNIWRFPTIAANDGGGAFLLVYIAITMTFGAVMMITEIALGRRSRKTPEGAYSGLDKRGSLLGKVTVLVPVLIMPYYCVVGGWILGYLAAFAMNMDMTASTAFGEFAASYYSLAAFLIFVVLVAYVIYKGVNKGIERVNKIFMPAFLIMLVLLTIYIIAQPGTGAGLSYYLGFDLSKITPDLFLDALGQAFYSLSLAMAIMITYG
ncbi:MAG: sodium-dependent transporter, partial [Candidatus Methanomethylophilaceae archaeon]